MSDVTRILSAIEQGDPKAAEQLLPLVYDELRKLAAAKMAQKAPGQTLQATALVHEAYIRLVRALGLAQSAHPVGDSGGPDNGEHETPQTVKLERVGTDWHSQASLGVNDPMAIGRSQVNCRSDSRVM